MSASVARRSVISIDPIALLEEHQAGCCAVCREARKKLLVDHDHATGLVRGLLCNGCNTSEGRNFRAPWLAAYRSNPPAKQLGLRVVYSRRANGMDVRVDVVNAMHELAARIRDAGWRVDDVWSIRGGVAFDVIDPAHDRALGHVALWSDGSLRGLYTWGPGGWRTRQNRTDSASRCSAAVVVETVADDVTRMLVVYALDRLLAHPRHVRKSIERGVSLAFDTTTAALQFVKANPRPLVLGALASLALLAAFGMSATPVALLTELANPALVGWCVALMLDGVVVLSLLALYGARMQRRRISLSVWLGLFGHMSLLAGATSYEPYLVSPSMPLTAPVLSGGVVVALILVAAVAAAKAADEAASSAPAPDAEPAFAA